ncbi:hypothetical protein FA15DRAFT_704855 [Coprinopsis marcescibilis]|uniref:MARVEL domain-containing protein n=1 Tax=Coprinopsis marcescibilis TaxID=230819 RepID=A0A5C3KW57_COPMA|nr:hypothetical protein FA15DRAFT_704855 [Coprinopsis marcescibilis]
MFSVVGKRKVISHVVLFVLNIVVLGLATKVNRFTDFFYVADLFPLAISVITTVLLFVMLTIDAALDRCWTGYAQTEAGVLGVLSIFWLGKWISFNAFSTSRWGGVPMSCDEIPECKYQVLLTSFEEGRTWCKDVHALKAFVWIVFLTCFGITAWTVTYTVTQFRRGNRHILKMPLSRYTPNALPGAVFTTSATAAFPQSFPSPSPTTSSSPKYPFGGFGSRLGRTSGGPFGAHSDSEFMQWQFEKTPTDLPEPLPLPRPVMGQGGAPRTASQLW